jgi:hypothetical protein
MTPTQESMTKAQLIRYFGVCQECGKPATYGSIDGVDLCGGCAAGYGLEGATD